MINSSLTSDLTSARRFIVFEVFIAQLVRDVKRKEEVRRGDAARQL
jgi:hypothetical protein